MKVSEKMLAKLQAAIENYGLEDVVTVDKEKQTILGLGDTEAVSLTKVALLLFFQLQETTDQCIPDRESTQVVGKRTEAAALREFSQRHGVHDEHNPDYAEFLLFVFDLRTGRERGIRGGKPHFTR